MASTWSRCITKLKVVIYLRHRIEYSMEETPRMQGIEPPAKKAKVTRVRYPNWGKRETIILVKAYQRQMDEYNTATSKGRMSTTEQKWERISSMCLRDGVARDAEQCRKRWQDLSKSYKKIKDSEGAIVEESFWLMSSSARKDKNLPGSFDREVYESMDCFMGSKVSLHLQRFFGAKERYINIDGDHDVPSGSLDGRSSAMLTYVEQESQGDPLLQEGSWALSKEQAIPCTDHRKHSQSSQADSGNDPISEALESAIRLTQERCSAQLMEVMADVLTKMADAMKTVAENMRNGQGPDSFGKQNASR